MINSVAFIKRLQEILDYYQLSAASLADKIEVQRSSISHLLSGRNKPSLDFVLKLTKQFEEVNLYWLLNGVGTFPHPQPNTNIKNSDKNIDRDLDTAVAKNDNEQSHYNESLKNVISKNDSSEIETIIVCFKNGKFKAYNTEE